MTFKEAIHEDIKGVFLNFDEFGEYHSLNGQKVLVIIDENELTDREKKYKSASTGGVDGELHNKQLLFYVAAEDFGPLPAPGRILDFDKKHYLITDAVNEDGIYSINLEAIRS